MADTPDKRKAEAATLAKQGKTQAAIAAHFGVSTRTIERWASEGGWGARKTAEKVVSINQAKPKAVNNTSPTPHSEPIRARSLKRRGEIDELQIVEDAIDNLSGLLGGMSAGPDDNRPIDTRGIGGIAGAMVKLLEYRRKIAPPTAAELAEQIITLGISPAEFVAELKQKWQSQQRA